MKKGFTLSEALIVMAAIGIVAVLTVPLLANEYQKKVQYAAFVKVYGALQDAMQYAILEHGSPSKWNYEGESAEDKQAFIDTYIAPYIKKVEHDPNCYPSNARIRDLKGQALGTASDLIGGYSMPDFLVLEDGGAISMTFLYSSATRADLFVDTNGPRGPNILGRDMFSMYYGFDSLNNKPLVGFYSNIPDLESIIEECCDAHGNSCTTGNQGDTCAGKLLLEEKMNY